MTLDVEGLREHERRNQAEWDADADDYQARHAAQLDTHAGLAWGVYQIPESELGILGDVAGKDVLELGCGAAQWSIGLTRLGARAIGLDLSGRQLEHARRAIEAAGLDIPLIHASAEAVPLPDASFDVVFCDHGAMTFADPYRTVPEVARLLRPGGLFAFSQGSTIADLVWPEGADAPGERLIRDYFGMHRIEEDDEVIFNLPYGAWIRLFRANGLEILDLIEPPAPPDATSSYRDAATIAWSQRWPGESIWRLRRT